MKSLFDIASRLNAWVTAVGRDIRLTGEHGKDVPVRVDEGPALTERKLADGKLVDADQHPHSIPPPACHMPGRDYDRLPDPFAATVDVVAVQCGRFKVRNDDGGGTGPSLHFLFFGGGGGVGLAASVSVVAMVASESEVLSADGSSKRCEDREGGSLVEFGKNVAALRLEEYMPGPKHACELRLALISQQLGHARNLSILLIQCH
ncbi:hypothetical protein B0H16DRAFT_1696524 [Mycena metata]|uniref:Uncharacterized protein n=1 Tax=Mycena metata TaxID=1033252 RepID=A0AAD7HZQ5_9AGAR|nr:hypothetical protein B0H16DRAFT_1696524 [Mycena metata]